MGQIYPTWGQICLTWTSCHGSGTRWGPDISGWLDNPTLGRICPTVPDGHGTGTRPGSDKSDTLDMSDLGSDISD
jgi:hypothetical protein